MMENEFSISPDLIYLNHAGVSPWPKRTSEAVIKFARENSASGPIYYEHWLQKERTLRGQLASLINAPSIQDIALLKNTSEALSVVASGLSWQAGDNIVSTTQEFPSNRIVWEALRTQGVETRLADLDSTKPPEDAVMALVDRRTRLIAISSVQYATGLRIDLRVLGEFCRSRGILFCVDAIQSLGAVKFDVQEIHADFVAADAHKWMLGPEGIALFYCRDELRDRLTLRQFGWHMVENVGDYTQVSWEPARSARRFECGSPNMLGVHALGASLSLLQEIGIQEVEKQVLAKARLLIDLISASPDFRLISYTERGRYAGIVNCKHLSKDPDQLVGELKQQHIYCAVRAGGIRLSPHFYTGNKQLETAVDTLLTLGSR